MVGAGRFNRRLTIERRAAGTDAAGQPNGAWAFLGYLWVDISGDTGKSAIRQSNELAAPTYTQESHMGRFADIVALGVTPDDRAVLDGEYFNIKGILRDRKRRELAYLVVEIGGNDG